jgi:hypothetical protein
LDAAWPWPKAHGLGPRVPRQVATQRRVIPGVGGATERGKRKRKRKEERGIVGTKGNARPSAARKQRLMPPPRTGHQKMVGRQAVIGPRSPSSVPQWTPMG